MKKENKTELSFLSRTMLKFKKFKEKRLIHGVIEKQKEISGSNADGSPYEARLSFGFGVAKVISVTILCVFLVITLIFGGSIISYENIYYMFKDIGYISSFSESRPQSLSYSMPFSNQDFASFKNGLAVAGDSEIKLFTSTGRVTLSAGSTFTNPKICSSDAFLLIYDQGRGQFAVYNSFKSVYSETLDYPISSADMTHDGSFCIVTRSRDYHSVVKVYDSKQIPELEYSKNDYVISAKLSPDGKYLAIVSLDGEGGEGKVSLNVIDRDDGKIRSTVSLLGSVPYTAEFMSNDRIALICSDSAHVYDLDCKRKNMFEYPYQLTHMAANDEGFALVLSDDGAREESLLVAFDRNCSLVCSQKISGAVRDMEIAGKDVLLLLDNEIRRVNTVLGSYTSVRFSEEDAELTLLSDGALIACTPTVAFYIEIN